jgi:hypothetical protein
VIEHVNTGTFGVDGVLAEGNYVNSRIDRKNLKIWLCSDDAVADARVYEIYDRINRLRFGKPVGSASSIYSPKSYLGHDEIIGDGTGSIISDSDLNSRTLMQLLHDGSNFALYIVMRTDIIGSRFTFGNANSPGSERGVDSLFTGHTPPRVAFRRYNASGTELTSMTLIDDDIRLGKYRTFCIIHDSGVTYGYSQKNVLLTSAADVGAPNINPAGAGFGIGSVRGAGPYLIGGFLELMIFDSAHDSTDRAYFFDYLNIKYNTQ